MAPTTNNMAPTDPTQNKQIDPIELINIQFVNRLLLCESKQ